MSGFQSKRQMAADKMQEPVTDIDGHILRQARKIKEQVRAALGQPAREPAQPLECTYGYNQCQALEVALQKRPWVGLTDSDFCRERNTDDFIAGAFFAETKLKERNHGT